MQDPELDIVRALLAAEIDLLKAQRQRCPSGMLDGIDYFIRMAEAVNTGGAVERIRGALEAIRDSRRAGLLQRLPDVDTAAPRAETKGQYDGADDTTRIAFPASP